MTPTVATTGSSPALLAHRAAAHPGAIALRAKELGRWRQYTWAEYAEQVDRIGSGLLALGVTPGDRVAILSDNRPEWAFCHLAIQSIAAVSICLDPAAEAPSVGARLAESRCVVLFAGDEEQFDKVGRQPVRLPDLRHIVVIDPRGVRSADDVIFLADLASTAGVTAAVVAVPPAVVTTDDGGDPMAATRSYVENLDLGDHDELLSFLPLAETTERMLSIVAALEHGYIVNFGDPSGRLSTELSEVQPTVILGVAAIWEAMRAEVETRAGNATRLKRAAFSWAMARGRRLAPRRAGGLGPVDRMTSGVAWAVIHRPVREKLGLARARVALCNGPPLDAATTEWFAALGVPVQAVPSWEAWGP
jgi:long-chain acyl-CoA synthetase